MLHQVFFSNSVVKLVVRQVTYIASFSNKLPEVTAPVESDMSAISEWVTPTINLHEGLFDQGGGQSLRQMMPDTDHGASCRGQIFSESDSASPLTMLSTTAWPRPTCWGQGGGVDTEREVRVEDAPGHAGRAHAGAGDP